jgi:hypothetical protein
MKLMNRGSSALSTANFIRRRKIGRFFNDDCKRVEMEADVSYTEVVFKEGLKKSTKNFNLAGLRSKIRIRSLLR